MAWLYSTRHMNHDLAVGRPRTCCGQGQRARGYVASSGSDCGTATGHERSCGICRAAVETATAVTPPWAQRALAAWPAKGGR